MKYMYVKRTHRSINITFDPMRILLHAVLTAKYQNHVVVVKVWKVCERMVILNVFER